MQKYDAFIGIHSTWEDPWMRCWPWKGPFCGSRRGPQRMDARWPSKERAKSFAPRSVRWSRSRFSTPSFACHPLGPRVSSTLATKAPFLLRMREQVAAWSVRRSLRTMGAETKNLLEGKRLPARVRSERTRAAVPWAPNFSRLLVPTCRTTFWKGPRVSLPFLEAKNRSALSTVHPG